MGVSRALVCVGLPSGLLPPFILRNIFIGAQMMKFPRASLRFLEEIVPFRYSHLDSGLAGAGPCASA